MLPRRRDLHALAPVSLPHFSDFSEVPYSDASLPATFFRSPDFGKFSGDPGLTKLHLIMFSYFACGVTSGFDNSLMSSFLTVMGNPSASTLADRWGRRAALSYGSLISIAGILVQTFAYSPVMYGAGRFLVGFGNLPVVAAGAAYVNEIAHPRYRGRIACFYQVIWYLGAIILPSLLQIVFATWTFCLIFWTPESPRWLMSKGRYQEACGILYRYHANGDTNDEMVTAEIKEISDNIANSQRAQGEMTWDKAFKTKGNRKRMMVVALFATSVGWTSQSIVSYYNTAILTQAGITNSLQQLEFNGGLSILDLVCAACGAILSGFIGRRTLILIGFCGMGVAHLVVTILASQYGKHGVAQVGYAVIAFIWVESAMYNIGLNPATYAYPAEIMSFALRAKGLVWFLLITDLNAIVTRYVNPVGLANIKWWYFVVFCFLYLASILGVIFLYPETRNKTLEEIEAEIDGVELHALTESSQEAVIVEKEIELCHLELGHVSRIDKNDENRV
ncbi:hypothetical protein JCM24511_06127 [Saitozyma sp. JCM 24511]|nr:hypothetical protein JCM24511_06127 [Saitozyma sp. JCM 24511]